MRKLIVILLFVPIFVIGQKNVVLKFNGGLVSFQNGYVLSQIDTVTFAERMTTSYLIYNSHFSPTYKNDVLSYLMTIFDENYIMPDASINWYNRYTDSSTADWFNVIHFDNNIAGSSNSKTGSAFTWQLGESIYLTKDFPAHARVVGEDFGIITTVDGWSGVTGFRLDNNNLDKELAKYNIPNAALFYTNANSFTGTYPAHELSSLVTNFNYSNLTDSIALFANSQYVSGLRGSINSDLGLMSFNDNDINAVSVDKAYEELAKFYSKNTPTKNLTIGFDDNDAPTCGDYNSNLTRLQSVYTDAGHTLTNFKATGNTGNLKVRPRLSLPDTVYMLTGEEYTVYDDGVTQKYIGEYALNVDYTCSAGSDTVYGYKFKETSEGYYQFIVESKECNGVVDEDTCIVRILDGGNGAGTKTILNIGNSLTYLGGSDYTGTIRTNLTGITADMVGTQGAAPNLHEGRSGWTFYQFLSSNSPFWDGSKIDFNNYRANTLSLGSAIDVVTIQLGINEAISNSTDTLDMQTTLIDSAKALIDYILADNTGAVVIALPPDMESTGDGFFYNYQDTRDRDAYVEKVHAYREAVNQTFGGKRYHNRVYVSHQGMTIDRDDGYPKDANGLHNNAVHPATSGYVQLANTMTAVIEAILNGE